MTDEQPPGRDELADEDSSGGIGPTNFGASAAEAGSVYGDRGPTMASAEGEPVGLDAGDADADTDSDQGQSVGDVYRGGQ